MSIHEKGETLGESAGLHPDDIEPCKSGYFLLGRDCHFQYWKTFLIFATMGAGASWVCPTALAQQIPYFEQNNPEGLCIATYMNASTHLGVLSTAFYFLIIRYICPIPHSIAVPLILLSSAFAAYLVSAVYSVTIDGISVFLFLCCAIGGSVGALASVVMNPFLTRYKNDFITASRSGGSICIVMTAVLAAIQSPGSLNPTFGTRYYMLAVAILLSLPIFAFFHITRYGIGLREETASNTTEISCCVEDESVFDVDAQSIKINGNNINIYNSSNMNNTSGGGDVSIDREAEERGRGDPRSRAQSADNYDFYGEETLSQTMNSLLHNDGIRMKSGSDDNTYDLSVTNNRNEVNSGDHFQSRLNSRIVQRNRPRSLIDAILACCLPPSILDSRPWLRKLAPLCAVIGFVNMNTWGIVTAVAPFAFKNVSAGNGASTLGRAYELGAVCLMLGDLSTALLHLPTHWAVLCFALFTSAIYVASVPFAFFTYPAAAPLLVTFFAFGRFFEAHLVTSTYRIIATEFHPRDRENAARTVGLVDQFSTTMGSILSSVMVAKYGQC